MKGKGDVFLLGRSYLRQVAAHNFRNLLLAYRLTSQFSLRRTRIIWIRIRPHPRGCQSLPRTAPLVAYCVSAILAPCQRIWKRVGLPPISITDSQHVFIRLRFAIVSRGGAMEELGYDLPKQPIAWIGTERVTISKPIGT